METTQDLLKAYKPETMLEVILSLLPQEKKDSLVLLAAKQMGFRFEADKMTLDRFWEIVALINWGEDHEDIDIDKMKLRLMRLLSPEEAEQLSERSREMGGKLAKAIRDWERRTHQEMDAHGDSWDDLLNHIVGCGKEEFTRTVEDPRHALVRYQSYDYTESFAYCIPWKDDYKKLGLEFYKKWARRVHDEWEERTCNGDGSEGENTPKDAVLMWLRLVTYSTDIESFRGALQIYDERDLLGLVNSLDIKKEHREFGRDTVNEHAVVNLVSDARKYLVPDDTDNEEDGSPR